LEQINAAPGLGNPRFDAVPRGTSNAETVSPVFRQTGGAETTLQHILGALPHSQHGNDR